MSLREYQKKRKFSQTPEPKGTKTKAGQGALRFVVQMHSASRLHFDFRLEFGGDLKSWAVPKGPSLNPQDQRLAVHVEDHPLEYGEFEGIIPKGNYGAGTVMVWDQGTYHERTTEDRKQSEINMQKGLEKGHMTFILDGQKLKGEFALIRLNKGDDKAWLLLKKRDEHSTYKLTQKPHDQSVKTGRTLDEIASESSRKGDIWLSKRNKAVAKPPLAKTPKGPPSKNLKTRNIDRQDPIPRNIKPMIATVSRAGVPAAEWVFAKSPEGLRALAEVEGKKVHFYSKSKLPFEKKFPDIVESLRQLDANAVFDGEVVKTKKGAVYFIYDLLWHEGQDLRSTALAQRVSLLKKVFKKNEILRLIEPDKNKSEGALLARNPDSHYHSGPSADWLLVSDRTVNSSPVQNPKKKSQRKPSRLSPARIDEARLTNLDKIFFPADGYTKGDLINYYRSVSKYILPYLVDRPESLNRHPNGIEQDGFYQKDMTGYIPKWFKTERIFSESSDKSIDYPVVQDERSLLYIVNLGCIEINPWFSRAPKLDKPDFLVIDLDPDDNDFDHVIEVAHEVHSVLNAVDAKAFVKTSGATGIHIGVPTGAKYDFDAVRDFAEQVCKIVQKKFPATTSVERNPARRKRKIYLDYMQNRRGQTLAAPFCVRPKPGAPVSMPLDWKDLRPGLRPEDFNIKNALRLIEKKGDTWTGVLGLPIDLRKCVTKLQKKFKT